jgi:cytochrome c oxidase assembly protein subunit 15
MVATLGLIAIGASVTSTGSGLAVPDWPLSFGQVFPPMAGGVLYEHSHRMAAAVVGILTVTLMIVMTRWEPRAWLQWVSRTAVLAVVLQGLLGGITVLWLLPTAISVSHACLAQAFLCLTVTLAACTGPSWQQRSVGREEASQPPLAVLAAVTTVIIYVQLILGALMRHTGAGLAIPDFPLAFGRLVPPLDSPAVLIHFLHRVGAVAVTLCIAWSVTRVIRQHAEKRQLLWPALTLGGLLLVQLALGALTIWTRRAVLPVTAHVTVGAAVLATSLFLTLRSGHLLGFRAGTHERHFLTEQVSA